MRAWLLQVSVAIALVGGGCGSDSAPSGGMGGDSGLFADAIAGGEDALVDSGVFDDASSDDGALIDGAIIDGGAADSGVVDDGAIAGDSGAVDDTGVLDDAGVLDDTGVLDDAGVLDDGAIPGDSGAAIADSGTSGDGGTGADANNLCTSSLDCIAGVESCGDIRVVNGALETHCTRTNPSPPALPIGGSCTQDSQCENNLCLDTFANECTVICADEMRDCPMGQSCTGYQYNPGPVWVYMCSRSCADNGGCGAAAGGNPGNICSTQLFQRGGSWFVDLVCQLPAGANALGQACTNGNDCQSGLCLTTTRNTNCMASASCMSDEACECPAGGAPPCTGGAQASCVSSLCSNVCDDNTDCAAPNQPLTTCRNGITLALPDGTTAQISSCGR